MVQFIKELDFLSPPFSLTFKNKNSFKTYLGALMSLIFMVAAITIFIFLSLDIFYRSSPLTRLNRHETEETKIYLKDFPLTVNFMGQNKPINSEMIEHFNINAISYTLKRELIGTRDGVNRLFVEPCRQEFYSSSSNFIPNIPIESQLCINPFKKMNYKGEIFDEDVYFTKDYLADESVFIQIQLAPKKDYENELLIGKYGSISVILTLATRYPDLTNFNDPIKQASTTFNVEINSKFSKTYYFEANKDILYTDDGVIFNRDSKIQFNTYSKATFDIQAVNKESRVLASFIFSSPQLVTKYSRTYLKIQTVLAQLSGIAKILLVSFKWIVEKVGSYSFYKIQAKKIQSDQNRNENANDSNVQIRSKKTNKLCILPSIWKYFWLSRKDFNLTFPSKDKAFELFDANFLFSEIQKLKNKIEDSRQEHSRFLGRSIRNN